ncbi:coiled-coil domain-containing protein 125 isoform X2 [Synchiropus splendidus]|uniref:coiled-coil domain-containing protein 125 isoform X2 n=1 Tax=Synchiropus splendidus TaxID=270530 RepID=UPI00237E164C|nr:coiled-coil domain-containing protein 125 isoform X2 [Synchiropus splendidus]
MQEVSAVGLPDDDMLDGDLGDGMGSRPPSSSLRSKFQSSSLVPDGQSPRRSCPSGEAAWKPKLKLAGWKQGACWKLPGPVAEVSKSELSARLQEAGQIIELLFCELEVAQRYLEGKYEALRILQGKVGKRHLVAFTVSCRQFCSPLASRPSLTKPRATPRASCRRARRRPKPWRRYAAAAASVCPSCVAYPWLSVLHAQEVNCLQWEVSFGQVQLRKSEQSWEQRHNRVVNENRSLSDTLEKRESEIQHLRAENSALSQQLLELLALLKVKEQRTYLATRPQYTPEKDATVLELAVLGACRCISVDESCPCSRTAAATRKQLLQLQQELDFQHSRREEALMVADAFRIAFEQQLRKRSDRLMLLAESNVHKLSHCKAEGVSRRPLVSVSQRLRALLPPNLELSVPDHLLEALYRLIDLLNDKEEALAHQRKVSIMLAHSAEELQKQLDLDCSPAQPAPDCQGAGGSCHPEEPSDQDRLHMDSTASQGQKADQNHSPAPSDAPPVSCDPARDQNHSPASSDASPMPCDPARDQNHGPAPSDAPPVSCDPARDQNHSPASSDASPMPCDPARDQNHSPAPSDAPPVSCDPARDQNHGPAPSDAPPVSCDPARDQNHGPALSDAPPVSCDPARDQNHGPTPSDAPTPPVSCDPARDQNHSTASSDASPVPCDPARDQNHSPTSSDALPMPCDPARDQNHGPAPSDAPTPPVSCDPARDQNHGPALSDAPPVSCDPARDQNHGPTPSDAPIPPVSCDPARDQNHSTASSDASPVPCDPARDQNHGPAPSDAPPVSCDPARDQNHSPTSSDALPMPCDPARDQNHGPAPSDAPAPPVSCDPARDQNHSPASSDAPPVSCDPARDQNHGPAPSDAPPVSCDPARDQNHSPASSDAPPVPCDPARDQNQEPVTLPPPEPTQAENPSLPNSESPAADLCEDQMCSLSQSSNCVGAPDPVPVQTGSPSDTVVTTTSCDDAQDPHEDQSQSVSGPPQPTQEQQQN